MLYTEITQKMMLKCEFNASISSKFKQMTQSCFDVHLFSGKQIGHWTCQVQDISQAIGCALTTYLTKYNNNDYWGVLFTCNYALSNIQGRSAYQPGEPTSKCHAKSANYPGLCANGGSYKLFEYANYP